MCHNDNFSFYILESHFRVEHYSINFNVVQSKVTNRGFYSIIRLMGLSARKYKINML